MSKDYYEIVLLELRQCIREAERDFNNSACVSFSQFKQVKRLKSAIRQELIDFRTGKTTQNAYLKNLMEG